MIIERLPFETTGIRPKWRRKQHNGLFSYFFDDFVPSQNGLFIDLAFYFGLSLAVGTQKNWQRASAAIPFR